MRRRWVCTEQTENETVCCGVSKDSNPKTRNASAEKDARRDRSSDLKCAISIAWQGHKQLSRRIEILKSAMVHVTSLRHFSHRQPYAVVGDAIEKGCAGSVGTLEENSRSVERPTVPRSRTLKKH